MTTAGLHHAGPADWSRRLVATGAAILVFGVGLVAACPALHLWLHPDAGQPDHECAVTLFVHGALETSATIALVVAPLLLITGLARRADSPDLIAPRYRLCPGRAPPGI